MDLFELLTPEEKAQYAKALVPSTRETIGAGVGGVADAISAYGHGPRGTNFMGDIQKRTDQGINEVEGYMKNQINENMRDYLAEKAAQKAGIERDATLNTIGDDFPVMDPDLSEKSALEIWKTKKAEQLGLTKAEMDMQKARMVAGNRQGKDGTNLKIGLIRSFNRDPNVAKFTTSYQTGKKLEDFLNLKNPIADASAKIMFARAAGEVGNLAQQEQAAFGGSKAIVDRLNQIFENMEQGTFTEENRNYLRQLAQAYQKAGKGNLTDMANRYANQYGQVFSSPEELTTLLSADPDKRIYNPMGDEPNKIRVISPDGREGVIPFEDKDEALAEGYRMVE